MLAAYRPKYLTGCVNMFYNVFTSEPWNHDWMKKEQVARYFSDMAQTPNFAGFLYFNNRELSGACFGVVEDYFITSQYNIKEIFIDVRYQHKGLGSEFIKEMEGELAARGVNNIALLTMKSIAAYEFYIKNEFLVLDDAVFMSKELQP